MAKRMLLDTSSLLYRAYFALPDSIKDPKGRPVNAVHGYLDMVARLLRDRGPDEIVHCLDDDWKPAGRVAAYEDYKSQRAEEPDDLTEQFELLAEVLGLLGMVQAWAPEWEAEDAIGTLCALAPKRDRIDIVTGDRDLLQLVRDPWVRVLITRRGVSDLPEMDEAAVEEKYGVPPSRYADFAILRGDPSDALPGVIGVGEKTARALVKAYDSLDEMLQDAQAERSSRKPLKGSPGLKSRVAGAVDYIASMRDVVPIRTDLEIVEEVTEPDDAALDRLAKRRRLEGPVRRVREARARKG
ncbi:MAG: 5'-3' exonuclease [Actinomycetota bacterium]